MDRQEIGRDGRIRTGDPLTPSQVRYPGCATSRYRAVCVLRVRELVARHATSIRRRARSSSNPSEPATPAFGVPPPPSPATPSAAPPLGSPAPRAAAPAPPAPPAGTRASTAPTTADPVSTGARA